MLWLYLTSFAILMGALLNAELEREAKGDAPAEPEGVDRDVVRSPSAGARADRPAGSRTA